MLVKTANSERCFVILFISTSRNELHRSNYLQDCDKSIAHKSHSSRYHKSSSKENDERLQMIFTFPSLISGFATTRLPTTSSFWSRHSRVDTKVRNIKIIYSLRPKTCLSTRLGWEEFGICVMSNQSTFFLVTTDVVGEMIWCRC
jgi:hypothetical protein